MDISKQYTKRYVDKHGEVKEYTYTRCYTTTNTRRGRPPIQLSADQTAAVQEAHAAGQTVYRIMKNQGLSRPIIQRAIQ